LIQNHARCPPESGGAGDVDINSDDDSGSAPDSAGKSAAPAAETPPESAGPKAGKRPRASPREESPGEEVPGREVPRRSNPGQNPRTMPSQIHRPRDSAMLIKPAMTPPD